jgi:hypothetical protein
MLALVEQHTLKNVNNCLNTNISSYLRHLLLKVLILFLNVVHFFQHPLVRHLWELETVIFLHWCLICAVLLPWLHGAYRNDTVCVVLPKEASEQRDVITAQYHKLFFEQNSPIEV